jgi:hypothetical protein
MAWLAQAFILAACLLLTGLEAAAQERLTMPALEFARIAIANGDLDTARSILDKILARDPKDLEANILMAQLEVRQGNLRAAAERYEDILGRDPTLLGVRLELAKTLFELHDDERAAFHFNHALAGPLPETTRLAVVRYLAAIRARKRYDLNLLISAAPDTNINAASGAREVTLFGLPFRTKDTEEKSGVGLVVAASGEARYPVSDRLRVRASAAARRNEYSGGDFDDLLLRTGVGPQLVSGDWDIRFEGVVARRWYGNTGYNAAWGPRLHARYHGVRAMIIESIGEYLDVDYDEFDYRDGDFYSVNSGVVYFPNPISSLQLYLGYSRELTRESEFSNRGYRLALGFARQLGWGLSVYAQPELFRFLYDSRDEAFGSTRRDWVTRAQLGIYKRTWSILGFSPTLNYIYTRSSSKQEISSYTRHQFLIGVTKNY